MQSNEEYKMYAIANNLIKMNKYEILYIDTKHGDIWLEKYENRTSDIIHLCLEGFTWKNHLKRDIARVFQKTVALRPLLQGKKIYVRNIYVAKHAPFDDWENLKTPMYLKGKNPIRMSVYYLEESNIHEELERLCSEIQIPIIEIADKPNEEMESYINNCKTQFNDVFNQKREEKEKTLSFGKPKITYLILLLNIIMFMILEANGGSETITTLIKYGAKYNPAIIMDGEWWRIISSMFLHIGLLHLLMNMLAVYYLGTMVEKIYGSLRFTIIYLLAGIGGGLASYALTTNVSAGASGALFGLFGALLFFGVNNKRIFFQTMGNSILLIIGINIALGFIVPQIDNAAHLGGLVTGFLAATVVSLPRKRKIFTQFIACIVYTSVLIGFIYFGTIHNLNSPTFQMVHIEALIKEKNYQAVVESATKAMDSPGEYAAAFLFQRSYAYIELNQINDAIIDLENSVELQADVPEAHFNLALLYNEIGEKEKAIQSVIKAYNLKPEDTAYSNLYEKITGEKVGK